MALHWCFVQQTKQESQEPKPAVHLNKALEPNTFRPESEYGGPEGSFRADEALRRPRKPKHHGPQRPRKTRQLDPMGREGHKLLSRPADA